MSPSSKKACLIGVLLLLLFACSPDDDAGPALAEREFKSSSVLQDEWMEAFYHGKKIGHVHTVTSLGTIGDKEVRQVKALALVVMEVEGKTTSTRLEQSAYLDRDGRLFAFDYLQDIMDHRMSISGRRSGDSFLVETDAGERRSREFKWGPDLYTSSLLKQAVLDRGLKPGEEAVFDVLIEPLLAVEKVTIELKGIESGYFQGAKTRLYRFEERFKGIIGQMVVTEDGHSIEETSLNGFSLLRADKSSALAPAEPLSMKDFLLSTKVKSSRRLEAPREIRSLRVMLKGVPKEYMLIEDQRQKVAETHNEINGIDYLLDVKAQALPGTDAPLPARESRFDIHLASDHVINADNKEIRALSEGIAGGERSSLRAARKIHDWIGKNIKKRLVDTVSALDTLKSGEGECQAHANLYAAIARAAGLPTKVVTGLVYSREFDGFMYHAWNEVWVGRWLAIDTILGGFPADATHIKLAEGSLEAQLGIISLIGRLEIDIINAANGD